MKTLKLLAAIVFIAFTTTVNAQEKTEVRDLKGFTGIDVSEGIKVLLTYGDKEYVEVTADEDIIDRANITNDPRIVSEELGSTGFGRPNMRDIAGEEIAVNENFIDRGNPTGDSRVVSEEMGMTGTPNFGRPSMADIAGQVNENLIGGAIVRIGDRQLDASVLRQINDLKQSFNKNLYIKDF